MTALPWKVLSDFDGTISLEDVTDRLLDRFADGDWMAVEAAWERGDIGSRECMEAQIAMLDVSRPELDAWLTGIALDPAFGAFVASARMRGIAIEVVSDGLDHVIGSLLARHGLGSLVINANQLVQVGERRWRLAFPHADDRCIRQSGTCKCALMREARRAHRVIYVGDGASDFCVAPHADMLLAKDRLLEHARAEGIPHQAIVDFAAATGELERLVVDQPAVEPDCIAR